MSNSREAHDHSTSSYEQGTTLRPIVPTPLTRCPLASAMEVLGGKWRAPLLWWLGQSPRHFGELRRRLPDISAKVLTQQLRALEEVGLLARSEEPSGRVTRVRYKLLPAGIELLPLLDQLCAWGATLPGVKLETE